MSDPFEVTRFVQITTTTQRREDAERIAERLLSERLAACVQLVAIASRYRWRGSIESADEWLCIIKTRADLFDEVERAVRAIHPYDVAELIATPLTQGSADYLAWIAAETESTAHVPERDGSYS